MKNCIWFNSSCQCIKEASRHWVFSRGRRNPSGPAEVSSHLRLGLNHWQSILFQGILPLKCASSVGHRSLTLLFLEVFQDPSVPLSAPSLHACEQGSESLGVSRCLRQILIIPGGRQHRHIYPEHLVLMDVQIQDSNFFVQLPPSWLVHYQPCWVPHSWCTMETWERFAPLHSLCCVYVTILKGRIGLGISEP